ncbi:MAG TPA: hypothetical protein VMI54_14620 [Polyangiaceae bacterium]|nr:hypothetical protein [Polyangiaceae bacterium]
MELALVLVLEFGGIVLAAALARAAFGTAAAAAVERVLSAIERATRAFLGRALTRAAVPVAFALAAVLGFGFGFGHGDAALAGALGVAAGALLAAAVGAVSSLLGARAAGRLLARATARFDLALATAVRGAGATGVGAQALGAAGALALLVLGRWVHHDAGSTPEAARLSALALPGYAFGAALVAWITQRAAGTYAAAARAGELRGEALDAAMARNATKNPALVSALVGERLEHGAAAARVFAASAVSASGLVWLALGADATRALEPRFIAFPLLLWGFGLVANGVALFVVRSQEAQGALPALARALGSAAGVWLVGLLGAGYWLFPEAWPPLAGAACAGFVASLAAACASARAFARRTGALREALDGLQVGPAAAQAAALGFGLGLAALAFVLVGGVALVTDELGGASGALAGDRLALMLALFGATAFTPFALAVAVGARLAETARAAGAMGGLEGDALARAQRVADSCQLPAAVARTALVLSECLAALIGSLALLGLSPGADEVGHAALLGAGVVLVAVGAAARRAARGAREVAVEVERQWRAALHEVGSDGRSPSYRACEELAGRLGVNGAASGAALVLLGPVLLGIALRLVYRESGPRLAAEAFATFVAGAAVTALGVALAVDGARAVLAGARRTTRPEGDPASHAASVTASALVEILGSAAGPAACTTAVIVTSLALLARTFFH